MEIRYEEIKELLPQKFHFIMVDRVVEFEKGKRAVGVKNVSANEIHFLGHFPGMGVFPGALILEKAGGRISDLDGKPLDFSTGRTLANNRSILASNGLLHSAAPNGLHAVHARHTRHAPQSLALPR